MMLDATLQPAHAYRGAVDPAIRLALAAFSPAGPRARLTTLIFHRVAPEPDPLFPGEPDARRFDEICGWLARWFNVLPLDEAVERLAARSLPARALVISFDDGYADNHDVAMPILRSHGLSATFFITTGLLDGGRMWNDTVVEAVRRCAADTLDLAGLGIEGSDRIDLSSIEARRSAVHRLLAATKYLEPAQRLATGLRIAERAGAALPDDLMMSRRKVRAMADAGMQIGAHTVSHPILAAVDETQARSEIARSKADLETIVGRPVTLFAYPNGVPGRDYGPRDVELVRRAGFVAAVSTATGAARSGSDLHELPRFSPWEPQRTRFGVRLVHNLFVPVETVSPPVRRELRQV